MNEKLMTAKEAAELTGLHAATIRKMAWQRRIRSYKVLGALRFKREDLEALIVERPALETKGAEGPPTRLAIQQSSQGASRKEK